MPPCVFHLLCYLFLFYFPLDFFRISFFMDPFVVPPYYQRAQSDKFFLPPWTPTLEAGVLCLLRVHCRRGSWIVGNPSNNKASLLAARTKAIEHFGAAYDLPDSVYFAKLKEWRRRFYLFRWLISCRAVEYNVRRNRVRCRPHVWRALSEVVFISILLVLFFFPLYLLFLVFIIFYFLDQPGRLVLHPPRGRLLEYSGDFVCSSPPLLLG